MEGFAEKFEACLLQSIELKLVCHAHPGWGVQMLKELAGLFQGIVYPLLGSCQDLQVCSRCKGSFNLQTVLAAD